MKRENYSHFYEMFDCERQVEFIYAGDRYFMYQYSNDNWMLCIWEGEEQKWLYEGYKTMDEILNAKIFDGKSFNEVDIEAYG